MGAFIARRIAAGVVILLVASFLIYILVSLSGNPLAALEANPHVPKSTIAAARLELHLNQPLLQRYWTWLTDFLQGNFGTATTGQAVGPQVLPRLLVTLQMVVPATLIAIVLGIVVGVVGPSGRRIVTYGTSGQPDGPPLDGDTEFEIGSITKVFTSLILADMVRDGEVRLDDPVGKFLPADVHAPERDGKPISLVDLATHTSGLPRLPSNMAPKDPGNPYADYTVSQLYQFLDGYQLTRDPGASWEYSNLGFGLLGHALALRAGEDYETLIKKRILTPLGMTDTTITLTPDETARLAIGHDSSLRRVENWDLPTLAGAGALRSTANDLLNFLAANLGYADTPVKSDLASVLSVRRPEGSPTVSQALGWDVLSNPTGEIVEHGGGTGGYHTLIAFNAKTRVGVVVLTNAETVMGADDIGMHILTGAPVASLPPPPPAPPERHAIALAPETLERLVGRYQMAPQFFITVTRDGGHLFAQLTGQSAYEVFPESQTAFFWKIVDAQLSFQIGPDGRATGVVLHQNGRDTPATRAP